MTSLERKEWELLQELVNKTTKGVVRWEETAEPNEFVTAFRGRIAATITRQASRNQTGEEIEVHYFLTVRDGDGRIVISRHERQDVCSPPLASLFEVARSSALRYAEEAIDTILEDLKKA